MRELINKLLDKTTLFKLLEWLLLLFIGIGLLCFTILIPPFQKPDEHLHFYRAKALANNQFVCQGQQRPFFTIEKSHYELPNASRLGEIVFQYIQKSSKADFIASAKVKTSKDTVKVYDLCNSSFVGYIPSAIGIKLVDYFDRPIISFYAARIFNGLFFTSILFICLLLIRPPYRYFLYFFSFIPIVLQQVTAVSYDAVQLPLALIIFSLVIHIKQAKKIKRFLFYIFSLLLGLFILVKGGFYSFILLFLIIPFRSYGVSFKTYLLDFSIVLILLLATLYYSISLTSFATGFPNLVDPEIQKQVVLQNPIMLAQASINSLGIHGDYYLESMISGLGWADYSINLFFVILYYCILAILIFKTSLANVKLLDFKGQGLVFFIALSSLALLFTSLYLVYTPVSFSLVYGIQGRYFLPLLPFAFLVLTQFLIKLGTKRSQLLIVSLGGLVILSILAQSIYLRYYDRSKDLFQTKSLVETYKEKIGQGQKPELSKINKKIYLRLTREVFDRKIIGFDFYFIPLDKTIMTPTKYYFMEKNCTSVIKSGFLDLTRLQKEGSYFDYFGQLNTNEKEFCLAFEPAIKIQKGLVQTVSFDNKPLAKLLHRR